MKIPHLLIVFRFLLAPLILVLACKMGNEARLLLVVLMFLGLLSDIFDGIIARKQNITTVKLRRMDSQVDLLFWLSIAYSCYMLQPDIFTTHKIGIISLFVMEAMCYATSFIKFGKETCTHAFLSKIWGLLLFATFVAILGFQHTGWLLNLTIIWGIISQADVILIILILPKWQNDIPSSYHAHLIRKGVPFKKSKLLND
ncbi:CDP-alcohol phosphatidyltransferase family protein [Flavobacterium sp. CBA20B-1]|uniref:CDP-alcohol phosphatidyltransferase family protein n=1 Tax=unclassified Flavobacterium TaxID=196869 RepID=UPI002224ACBA|nr:MULTISPECIES: CDP-alcohol phosphatidyltransferase family protein [unclassified Flavobacterium]WCM42144.1 CDP-alcohol phosphatidyltransferase family protein [Flavobacterium sp. CBA20B-1]